MKLINKTLASIQPHLIKEMQNKAIIRSFFHGISEVSFICCCWGWFVFCLFFNGDSNIWWSFTDILFIGKKISITFLGNNLMLHIRGLKIFMFFDPLLSLSKSMQKKSYEQSTEMFTTLLIIKRKNLIFCSEMVL